MKERSIMEDRAGKRILVLSDSDFLFEVIEANLRGIQVDVDRFKPELTGDGDFDLIVVAISLPTGEPLVALSDASLLDRVGQIPILIISDRRFDASQKRLIFHLDFPFDSGELCHKVWVMLADERISAGNCTQFSTREGGPIR